MPDTNTKTPAAAFAQLPISKEEGERMRYASYATREDLPSSRRIDPTKVDMAAISQNLGCYVAGD